MPNDITRREALRRVSLVLGGALAASTVAGALAIDAAWAAAPEGAGASAWAPSALTAAQTELVATLAEHIIPATDTPGARAAGVHRFVDSLLAGHYPEAERARFLAGLAAVDARARERHGRTFVQCTAAQRVAMLTEMDRDAYPARGAVAQAARAQQAPPRDQIVGPSSGGAGPLAQRTPADVAGSAPAADPAQGELRSGWFWRRMKELTLTGYYTSQVGATQELRVNPMGVWRGDVPYRPIGRSWA